MTAEDMTLVVEELRLLRGQQWDMHSALVGEVRRTNERLDETNQRLEQVRHDLLVEIGGTNERLDQTNECLVQTNECLLQTHERLAELARYTVDGFHQVVDRASRSQAAFERFVDLVMADRRELRPEIDHLKARVDVLERKAG